MATEADILVIFGITGDLAKKMTFQALYRLEQPRRAQLPPDHRRRAQQVGARTSSTATLASRSPATVEDPDEEAIKRLEERLDYVQGEFDDARALRATSPSEMGDYEQAVFYLEIPPSLFGMVVEHLHEAGLTEKARVVFEKPFGHDRDSARAAQRRALRGASTRTRSCGSTTSSARSR